MKRIPIATIERLIHDCSKVVSRTGKYRHYSVVRREIIKVMNHRAASTTETLREVLDGIFDDLCRGESLREMRQT